MKTTTYSALIYLLASICPLASAQTPVPRFVARTDKRARMEPELHAGVPGDAADHEGFEGDVEARQEWFIRQREYPFDSIPADARRKAWLSFKQPASKVAAQTWTSVGPVGINSGFIDNWGRTSGRVNTIAVSPRDPSIVLIGGATGGIWRSTDAGANFAPVTDNQVDLAVGSIVFALSDPTIVYAGMGDGDGGYLGSGILKSTDAGKTWTRVSNDTLPSPGYGARIAVDPSDANRLYLAQFAAKSGPGIVSSGVFYSTDGGVTWTRTLAGLATDIITDTGNPQIVYAAMRRVDEGTNLKAGVYKSLDGGQTWSISFTSPYSNTQNARLATSPSAPGDVFLFIGGVLGANFEIRLEVSPNAGITWTKKALSGVDPAQFFYDAVIAVDPTNANTVYLATRDVYKSLNGGSSWTSLTNNFDPRSGAYHPGVSTSHPDQHAIAFVPGNSSTFYIGNDGGISKTVDGGATFTSLNATLTLTQFTSLALHPTDAAISYGGTQDNGTERRLSHPNTWEEFAGGDGGNCVIDAATPSIVYTSYIFGYLSRFTENGDTYDGQIANNETFGEGGSPRIGFYAPFTGNGVDSTLYFGSWRLFISTNHGDTWFAPAGTLDLTGGNGNVLSAIGVARSNTSVIYTGSSDGRAMVSTDAGAHWHDVTAGLPNRYITQITVAPDDAATAYLEVSGFGSGHIFKTTDTGATWTDISANLPDIPVSALLIDPLGTGTLFAGTDVGIFVRPAESTNWYSFNYGIPPVIITAFGAQSNGLIQAASYGRGAYELAVPSAPTTVKLKSPNGGETLRAGETATIAWTSSGDSQVVSQSLLLSTDGGATYPSVVASDLRGDVTSFDYAIPTTQAKTKAARFRVVVIDARGTTVQDDSNRNVKIKRARH